MWYAGDHEKYGIYEFFGVRTGGCDRSSDSDQYRKLELAWLSWAVLS